MYRHSGGPRRAVEVPFVRAVGVAVAADELPELAELHDEVPRLAALLRALWAALIEPLLEALHLELGLLERTLERAVELVEHLNPAHLPLSDVVELDQFR